MPGSEITGPPSYNMGVTSRVPAAWESKSEQEVDRQVTECSFDWYQATFPGDPRLSHAAYAKKKIDMLADHLKPFKIRYVDRGLHGYQGRTEFVDARGGIELTVLHGGNPKPNVKVTSHRAAPFASLLRALEPHHAVTRVDAAVDFSGDHVWEAALKTCRAVMDRRGMDSGLLMLPDGRHKGTTYYMGSFKSPVMARLYEKGLEQIGRFPDCGADPTWTRLELQVRPQKQAKANFASLSATDTWGATKWSRELIGAFSGGAWQPESVRVAPRTETEWERTQRFFTHQYARHMFDGAKLVRDRMIIPGKATNWREGLRLYMSGFEEQVADIIGQKIRDGIWYSEDRTKYDVSAPAILPFGSVA